MSLLAIDIGTTHCKAGLFKENGSAIKLASREMKAQQMPEGWMYYDPGELIALIIDLLREVQEGQPERVAAVGVTSMSETGILLDRTTGSACSPLIPWFETASQPYADHIASQSDPFKCYAKFGLKISFKPSLTKILWLKDGQNISMLNKVWLSAADYVVYWLTGKYQTDVSLASRTLAFRLDGQEWDRSWLKSWNLPEDLFPPVLAAGEIAGEVNNPACGILPGTPTAVCGHDHISAAFAMGAVYPGMVFDSMGTAETLVGALPKRSLNRADYENGLLYGCHTAQGMGYWLGGASASGGSVEWFRWLPGLTSLSYADLAELLKPVKDKPTGILYFPYLLGSGSPHTDPSMRGAFIGLSVKHSSGDLYKAILEGTTFELEVIRRAGEAMSGQKITLLTAAGGGVRNRAWMQVKADVTGCTIRAASEPEASLLGAALLAGIGSGIYKNTDDALARIAESQSVELFEPNPENYAQYQELFNNGYLTFQEPLRRFGTWSKHETGALNAGS